MPKKIALDYDESELRIVVANCNGGRVHVTDAQVIPVPDQGSVSEKLRGYINENGLQKTETLIAIGRGKAELRELQLPPVPEEELPDMVRFQAIRSFASASDRAIVDFLVTGKTADANSLIAGAVAPVELDRIRELCGTSDLITKRVALRPLAAASLYLRKTKTPTMCAMIDLLADDAEIVIARDGKVVFVRTVRLPSGQEQRSKAIASELKRTMVACGEAGTPNRIVVWGTEAVHREDLRAIRETMGCDDVQAVSPFDLVDLQMDSAKLPEHIGRLAPLVGLLACDEASPETLIDFLNPRERMEEKPDRARQAAWIGVPIAAVLLIGFLVYQQFRRLDAKIQSAQSEVNEMLPMSEAADESIARTEAVDQFLDADVNWLDEMKRLAQKAPPSEKLIVRSISAQIGPKAKGGSLIVTGAVTDPDAIEEMEASLRDDGHSVFGKGSKMEQTNDAYRWTFTETISLDAGNLRNTRYSRMSDTEESAESSEPENSEPENTAKTEDEA